MAGERVGMAVDMSASQMLDDTPMLTSAIGKSGALVTTSDFMLLLAVSEVRLSVGVASSPSSLAVLSQAPSTQTFGASTSVGPSLAAETSNMPIRIAKPPRTPRMCPASDPINATLLPLLILPPAFEARQLSEKGAFACSTAPVPREHSMERSPPIVPVAPTLRSSKDPFDAAFLPKLELDPAESLCEVCLDGHTLCPQWL